MAGYDCSLYQTYLSNIPMFRSCSAEHLDRLAESGEAVSAGDAPIFNEGDAGDDFFVITSGAISLVSLSRDAFKRALDEMPQLRDALLHGMAHRIHQLDARV